MGSPGIRAGSVSPPHRCGKEIMHLDVDAAQWGVCLIGLSEFSYKISALAARASGRPAHTRKPSRT